MELSERDLRSMSSQETIPGIALTASQKLDIDVPDDLRKALLEFSIAFLVDKPKDVVEYAVKYFTSIQNKRTNWRPTITPASSNRPSLYDNNEHVVVTEGRRSYVRSSQVHNIEPRAADRNSILLNQIPRSISEDRIRTSMIRKGTDHRVSIRQLIEPIADTADTIIDFDRDSTYMEPQADAERYGHLKRESKDSAQKSDTQRHSKDIVRISDALPQGRNSARKSDPKRTSGNSMQNGAERQSGEILRRRRDSSMEKDSIRRSIERAFSWHRATDRPSTVKTHYWYRAAPLPRRKSIFTESIDPENVESVEENLPLMAPKPTALRRRLRHEVKNVLVFQSLDPQQLRLLLDAMVEVHVTAGQIVAQQGSPANDLFVIHKGTFKVYRDNIHVYTFQDHGVFGELALISAKTRMATIVAETDGLLWSIDRQTFRTILLTKAYNKRNFYEQQLQKVYMLQVLSKAELMNLADALQEITCKQGEVIFKEGDIADGMYLVVEGVVQITATDKTGVEREVQKIGEKENFFGELCLLKTNTKRPCSAVALSRTVHLAFLSVDSFERIVGDSLRIVQRSIGETHPHYADVVQLYKNLDIDVKLF